MRAIGEFAIVLLFGIQSVVWGDSNAYVVASGISFSTPGSITPFNTTKGSLGAAFFVPAGGYIAAVAPRTGQIWEAVASPDCICVGPWAINILDPTSGSTLTTIPLTTNAAAVIFDAVGRYAYVSLGNGDLIKIDVAARSIIQTAALGTGIFAAYTGGIILSGDGSKLFLDAYGMSEILVLDPRSLKTLASIPVPLGVASIFASGSTLLITDGAQLLYFDARTLQQTNSVTVPQTSFVFGVSPDGSKIYLDSNCLCGSPNTIEILDFASGQTLVTQIFPNVDLVNVLLSQDGAQVVVASNPILLVDPNTLATIKTIWSVGIANFAAYLDASTVLMLNPSTGAMMVIDQASAQLTSTFPLGISPLSGEVVDPTRGLVYVGAFYYQDGVPNVVSAKLNRIVKNLSVRGGFSPTAVAGDQLYGLNNGSSQVYNLRSGVYNSLPLPVTPPPGDFVTTAVGAAPPNGRTYWTRFSVYSSNGSTVVNGTAIYNTAANSVIGRIALPPGGFRAVVFSPDSSTAYLAGTKVIAVYSTTTFQNIATFNYTTTFTSLVTSPDGSVLYATDGAAIYVLDATTGVERHVFALPPPSPSYTVSMAISPDGTTLFLTDPSRNAVNLVNAASGQVAPVSVPYTPTSVVVLQAN